MNTGRAVVLKGTADMLARAAGLITFPILARCAGPDGYGAYGQVNTVVGLLVPFCALGLSSGMVRFFAGVEWNEAVRRRLMSILGAVICISGAVSVLMSLSAPLMNRLFLNWKDGPELFRWGAFLVLAGATEGLLLEFLRARELLAAYSLLQICQTCLLVLSTAVLLPGGYGVVGLVKALVAIKILLNSLVVAGFYLWDRPRPGRGGVDATLGRMVAFGLPLAVSGLGLWMMNFVDRLVIGHFMSASALGLYGSVYGWAGLLLAVNSALNLPLYPRLMKAMATGGPLAMGPEVSVFHRYAVLGLVPGMILLICVMKPLILVMGGSAFRVQVFLVACIVIATFLDQWNAPAQYILMCVDKVVYTQNAWLITGILNGVANWFIVPRYGLNGAGAVTVVTFIVLEGAVFLKATQYCPLLRHYRFDVSWKALAACLPGTALCVVWNWGRQPLALALVLQILAFGLLYLGSLAALGELRRQDVATLQAVFAQGRGGENA